MAQLPLTPYLSKELMMSNETTSTYMENYMKLQQAANELSQQNVPDVDKIIPLVKQGSEAYTHCMSRINEVERILADIENKTALTNSWCECVVRYSAVLRSLSAHFSDPELNVILWCLRCYGLTEITY